MSNLGFQQLQFSAEALADFADKQARFNLFRELQFTNQPGAASIVSAMGKPKTQAGVVALETMLASNNKDWEVTKRRQAVVRELVNNKELRTRLQAALEKIKNAENTCLGKFAPVHPMVEAMQGQMAKMLYLQLQVFILLYGFIPEYRNKFSVKGLLGAEAALVAAYGFNTFLAEKIAKMDGLSSAVNAVGRLTAGLLPLQILYWATWNLFRTKTGPLYWLATKAFTGDPAADGTSHAPSWQGRGLLSVYALAGAGALGYKFWIGFKESQKAFAETNVFAEFVTAFKELRDATAEGDSIAHAYEGSFDGLSQAWSELEARAEKHKSSSGPNLLCTNNSNINNMMALIKNTSADVSCMIQFYGELDAYVSIAQFVADHQATENKFGEPIRACFAEFIENSDESIVDAGNVWHPLIPVEVVRPNSFQFGGSSETPRNGIITGPNAAGKSVTLKSLLVNLVLAQTFGVACAESFRFTPFAKIIGRMTAPDDTSRGRSKFLLEAEDVVGMLTQIKGLAENEHAFVVTDELFSGTEVGPAIELSKRLCERVSRNKRVIYLLATHYKDLVHLKTLTNNLFENYKVSVFKEEDGGLVYPFKLAKGVGTTNVAFDIFLKQIDEQGLVDQDLKDMIIEARAAQEAQEAAVAA